MGGSATIPLFYLIRQIPARSAIVSPFHCLKNFPCPPFAHGSYWAAKFARVYLAALPALRDETTLLILILVGAVVYAGAILLLFGKGWLRSLVRS